MPQSNHFHPSRRRWLRTAASAAALGLVSRPFTGLALPPPAEGEEVVPFLDPQSLKPGRAMVNWEKLKSWITPAEDFFTVQHYGVPEADPGTGRIRIEGMVEKPGALTLQQIKNRATRRAIATLECAGNGVSSGFMGALGNARWGGAPLLPLLEEHGILPGATEVVFYAADEGKEKIRDNEYAQPFARSMSIEEVRKSNVMLVHEMNGEPLPKRHGGPLRVGAAGHYGVAWVKWLHRIELIDRRFSGRFMARDYVTIRGERQGDQILWREKNVSRMNLKSIVARVVRRPDGSLRVMGAAWNDGFTPLQAAELRIDGGPWQPAAWGEGLGVPHAWTFWSYDWTSPSAGEHTLVSRARDVRGRVQPAPDDDSIALKKTYWEANQQVVRRINI